MLYEYECKSCGYNWDQNLPMDERDDPCNERCFNCLQTDIIRICGNSGGFRLGANGNVSWASGGYSTYLGDTRRK